MQNINLKLQVKIILKLLFMMSYN